MGIKRISVFMILMLLLSSCDPSADMEATIKNTTTQSLTVDFVPSADYKKISLQILPNGIELFQERFSATGRVGEPSLEEYDSVVIKNQIEKIVKVYKQNGVGKNIYNISDWTLSTPMERSYRYEFEIQTIDIE